MPSQRTRAQAPERPVPGSTNNALDAAKILPSWRKVKHDFHETRAGYKVTSGAPPATWKSDIETCANACPASADW